jgi:hypothetical protein
MRDVDGLSARQRHGTPIEPTYVAVDTCRHGKEARTATGDDYMRHLGPQAHLALGVSG